MFTGAEDRQVTWARENVPLLALRSDTEVRRIVRAARRQMRAVRLTVTFTGFVVGLFLANWVQKKWLDGVFSKTEEDLWLMAAAALLAAVGGIASEVLLRKRIEVIANDA